jgi:cell division protein FtsB
MQRIGLTTSTAAVAEGCLDKMSSKDSERKISRNNDNECISGPGGLLRYKAVLLSALEPSSVSSSRNQEQQQQQEAAAEQEKTEETSDNMEELQPCNLRLRQAVLTLESSLTAALDDKKELLKDILVLVEDNEQMVTSLELFTERIDFLEFSLEEEQEAAGETKQKLLLEQQKVREQQECNSCPPGGVVDAWEVTDYELALAVMQKETKRKMDKVELEKEELERLMRQYQDEAAAAQELAQRSLLKISTLEKVVKRCPTCKARFAEEEEARRALLSSTGAAGNHTNSRRLAFGVAGGGDMRLSRRAIHEKQQQRPRFLGRRSGGLKERFSGSRKSKRTRNIHQKEESEVALTSQTWHGIGGPKGDRGDDLFVTMSNSGTEATRHTSKSTADWHEDGEFFCIDAPLMDELELDEPEGSAIASTKLEQQEENDTRQQSSSEVRCFNSTVSPELIDAPSLDPFMIQVCNTSNVPAAVKTIQEEEVVTEDDDGDDDDDISFKVNRHGSPRSVTTRTSIVSPVGVGGASRGLVGTALMRAASQRLCMSRFGVVTSMAGDYVKAHQKNTLF